MAQAKPTDINKIWANGGDIVAPNDSKINTGWIVEFPPHTYFNYLQNRTDKFCRHVNEQGIPVWDSGTSYVDGSITKGSDGNLYVGKQASTNKDPITEATYWQKIISRQISLQLKLTTDAVITASGPVNRAVILFDDKELDTDNIYDPVTGKLQPTKSGWFTFYINGELIINSGSGVIGAGIAKNGLADANILASDNGGGTPGVAKWISVIAKTYLNGTTDYVQFILGAQGTVSGTFLGTTTSGAQFGAAGADLVCLG